MVAGSKNGTHGSWCFFSNKNILFWLDFPCQKWNDGIEKIIQGGT